MDLSHLIIVLLAFIFRDNPCFLLTLVESLLPEEATLPNLAFKAGSNLLKSVLSPFVAVPQGRPFVIEFGISCDRGLLTSRRSSRNGFMGLCKSGIDTFSYRFEPGIKIYANRFYS